MKTNKITTEMKNDLIAAYNDAKQLSHWLKTSPPTMDDDILIELADNIIHWLSKYVNDEDEIQDL